MRLWNRKALIVVDTAINSAVVFGTDVPALSVPCGKDGFDCRFDIHKDLTGKPNHAKVEIFNLTEAHRAALSERAAKGPVRVRLDAGYEGNVSRIFEGDMRLLFHDRDQGADIVTVIESGDGERAVQSKRLSKSWGPGTSAEQVLKDVAQSMGFSGSNFKALAGASLQGWGTTFTNGTAVNGPAFPEFTNLCRSVGVEWSIQDGTLQLLQVGKALDTTAVKVTSKTGMEGSWKLTSHKKVKLLVVNMRLIPDVWPGRKIQLENKEVWRVAKATYRGETRGGAWNVQVECTEVL